MLDRFRAIVRDFIDSTADNEEHKGPDNVQLAAAALMYNVVQADGILRNVEKEKLAEILRQEYALGDTQLDELMTAAKTADSEAVDLYQFTSVLMSSMSEADRIGFIEILWEVVYADGVRDEVEDNVVWRISELLGVSDRERVLMRQRVQQRVSAANGHED